MIVIIDYGLGNLASVKNALDKINIPSIISNDPTIIRNSKGIILPGVGAAPDGMKNLKAKGLDKLIKEEVMKGKPFLGICLGMQLLFDFSEEGNTKCLGIIPGRVKLFNVNLKVPQIGWNNVLGKGELFKDIPNNSYFYFVHSYYCNPADPSIISGETNYGIAFCSMLQDKNIYATQFHPEKSGDAGLKLLKNFIDICIDFRFRGNDKEEWL